MKESTAKQLLEKVKRDYALIASDFDMTRRGNWEDFSVFDKYLKDGYEILDIGCGNGRLLDYLSEKARIKYKGVDNNEKFIEIAKKKGSFFKTGDFLALPYSNCEFDLVLSVAVFHHIPSRKLRFEALDEVSRVMKDGGVGVFLVWNLWQKRYFLAYIKSLLRFLFSFGKYDRHDFFITWGKKVKRYYHAFTQHELVNLFQKSGLQLENVSLSPSKKNFVIIFSKNGKRGKSNGCEV